MNIIVYHHYRSLIASTNAIGQLKGKSTVWSCFVEADTNLSYNTFRNGLVVFQEAGQALTDSDDISTLRFYGEK